MSKARGLADLGNVYDDGALSNRNLIINGAMQVAQRGTSATYSANTGRGYVLDRWYGEGYPLNATISQGTLAYDGITYECAALSSITGNYFFYQAVEDGVKYNKGKTLTLSFVASGSGNIQCQYNAGTVGTVNIGSAISLTGTPTKYSVTFSLSGSATGDDLFVGFNGSGGSFNVSLAQLEVGDTATPFEHRSYSDQLQSCMRYYYRLYKTQAYQNIGNASMFDANNVYVTYQWPVVMRANPSVSLSSASDFNVTGNGSDLGATGYSVGHASPFNAQINLIRFGLTNGYAYWVRMAGGGEDISKFLQADAEL
jgi:membrane-bound inhibitor of C-type lysozyme